jgi:hypothetical protein
VLGRAFQSVAGSYAILGAGPESFDPVAPATRGAQSLLDQGLGSDDDHDIKLSECCARESALGTPDVLAAAEAWLA